MKKIVNTFDYDAFQTILSSLTKTVILNITNNMNSKKWVNTLSCFFHRKYLKIYVANEESPWGK